jgi:hypothetical protein
MQHVAHSDWMFDHSLGHHLTSTDPSTDTSQATQPTQTDAAASAATTLWHHTDASSSTQSASGSSASSNTSTSTASPALTVTSNALTVNAGGSVSLPISVSPANGHTSVTIAGLTNYETVTDSLDGKTFTPDANGSITLSAAEVNSGISLASNYTGSDHPVNTLTVTAAETFAHHTLTSASQSITVTDPPASTSGSGSSTSSGSNSLTLQVSGDQYNGDPQIEVFVDGQQMGGTYTVTADHASGQTQTITITGNFNPDVAHQVQVEFVNDAWDGTSWWTTGTGADGHDRNVYIESIALNGQTLNGSQGTDAADPSGGATDSNATEAPMYTNGTVTFNVPADPPATTSTATTTGGTTTTGTTTSSSGSNSLTLQVSGDQYNGDPQIEVFVDGQQVGGTYTVTADHASGQTQTITISGNFNPDVAHQVQVEFVNDAWDGTSWWTNGTGADGHDRNVYIESIALNGQTLNGSQGTDAADPSGGATDSNATEAPMYTNGTVTFNVPADPPATTSTSTSSTSGSGSSTSSSTSSSTDPSTTTSTDPSTTTSSDPSTSTSAAGTSAASTGAADPAQTTNAFYVSPDGSDSNPGTLAAPFATLQHAQQAMEDSSTKTTYVEGGTYNMSSTLALTSADSGETWQYYAPNGVDSAILNGGDSVATGISINGASNVTIDGLTVEHFASYGIYAYTSPGTVIENNNVGFISDNSVPSSGVGSSAGITVGDHVLVENNYVHDTASAGITAFAYDAGDSVDGTVITGNVVLSTCLTLSDCGAIYTNMDGTGTSGGHVTISNNYVSDYGSSSNTDDMVGIYLDDNSSNVTVTGNVVGPPPVGAPAGGGINNTACILINGNSTDTSDVITDNILDTGSSSNVGVAYIWGQNNVFENNIVLFDFSGPLHASASGNDFAYEENFSNTTIANNIYWNYASGGSVFTTGNMVSDSNPIVENPQLSGVTYTLASSSPALSSINFTPIVGGWGPTGFVIPTSINASTV